MPVPNDVIRIDRRPARDVVLEHLTAWIEGGDLGPGELIKDGDLAERLGVSRTPVREALQILEQRGLVEMRPGRLTRVTDTAPQEVARVYAPLSALQALAAELGTPNAGPEDIDEMRRQNAKLLAAVKAKNPEAARDADREFHGVLVRLAANPYLTKALEPLLSHIRRLEALYFGDQKPGRESHDEHEQIIAAVAANDAVAASQMTRRNFGRYWKGAGPDSENAPHARSRALHR
jgi:DNA-binding GntR family transcriptional regulator